MGGGGRIAFIQLGVIEMPTLPKPLPHPTPHPPAGDQIHIPHPEKYDLFLELMNERRRQG